MPTGIAEMEWQEWGTSWNSQILLVELKIDRTILENFGSVHITQRIMYIYTRIFIATVFLVAKTWKLPKCPLTVERKWKIIV